MPRDRYEEGWVEQVGKKRKKWRGHYHVYDADGTRHHKTETLGLCSELNKSEARAKLRAVIGKAKDEAPVRGPGMTLEALFRAVFLPLKLRKWSYNTRRCMEDCLKNHVYPRFGNARLSDLDKTTIQQYLIELADDGSGKDTVGRVLCLMRAALEEAVDNDYLAKNPAHRVEVPPCKARGKRRVLTQTEVQKIIGSTTGMMRLAARIMIGTGMRLGECMALRRDDLIFAGRIQVDETVLPDGQFGPPKDRETRYPPLPASIRKEIDMWMEARPEDPKSLVFEHEDGGPYYWNRAYALLNRMRKATAVKDLTWHAMRRTFSSLAKGDVMDVADVLGHSRPEMTTDHYKAPLVERQAAMVEALDAAILDKSGQQSAKKPVKWPN